MSSARAELLDALRWMVSFEETTVDTARERATTRQLARVVEMLAPVDAVRGDPSFSRWAGDARSRARAIRRQFGPVAVDCVRETLRAVAAEQRRLIALAAAVDLLVGRAEDPSLVSRVEASVQSLGGLADAPTGDDSVRLHREVGGWEVCLGALVAAESELPTSNLAAPSGRDANIARQVRLAFNDVLEPFDDHLHALAAWTEP